MPFPPTEAASLTTELDNPFQPLIGALRAELQEYGGLLQLLDQQQTSLLGRRPDEVLAVSDAIQAHVPVLLRSRKQREACARELTKLAAADAPPSPPPTSGTKAPLAAALDLFPQRLRPLAEALVEEINGLVARVERRARQNQLLLTRALDSTQLTLRALDPAAPQRTYTPAGRVQWGAATAADGWTAGRCAAVG